MGNEWKSMESPNKVSLTSVWLAAVRQGTNECMISAHLEDYRLSFYYKKHTNLFFLIACACVQSRLEASLTAKHECYLVNAACGPSSKVSQEQEQLSVRPRKFSSPSSRLWLRGVPLLCLHDVSCRHKGSRWAVRVRVQILTEQRAQVRTSANDTSW